MHNITKIDQIDSIIQSWHGLSRVVSQDEINRFENGALDWKVEKTPIYFGNGQDAGYVLATEKDGNKIPLVSLQEKESYSFLQNSELFDVFRILIDEFGFNVFSAGSIGGRKRVFWTLENGAFAKADKVKLILNVTSSHDKSCKTEFYNSAVRIVCANTWKASQDTKQLVCALKKTRNVAERIKAVNAALIEHGNAVTQLDVAIEAMAAQVIDLDKAKAVATGVLKPSGTRGLNIVNEVTDLFIFGKGNNGKTVYDLFNGFTERFTHGATDSKKDKFDLFVSSEFGAYSTAKENVFNLFQSEKEVERLAKEGEKLLLELAD
jgi:hypothetical protein